MKKPSPNVSPNMTEKKVEIIEHKDDNTVTVKHQPASQQATDEQTVNEKDKTSEQLTDNFEQTEEEDSGASVRTRIFKFVNILLPHVVLMSVMLIYLTAGAIILAQLETGHELSVRRNKMSRLLQKYDQITNDTWHTIRGSAVPRPGPDEWHGIIRDSLLDLGEIHEGATFRERVRDFPITNPKWTFPTSFLNAVTLLSACGYNEVTTYTPAGQTFAVIFTLLGIPLMFVTAANIGKFLSECLLETIRFIDFIKFHYRKYQRRRRRLSSVGTSGSTIRRSQRRESIKVDFGVAVREQLPTELGGPAEGDELLEGEHADDEEVVQETSIKALWFPILIYVSGISAYCCMGSLMFRTWEPDWSFVHAFHFGFNLIVTIGLGNIVVTDYLFFVLLVAFIVVGLAVVTMCVDLASSHLKEYFMRIHYFGREKKYQELDEDLHNMIQLLSWMRQRKGGEGEIGTQNSLHTRITPIRTVTFQTQVTWREVRDLMEGIRLGAFNPKEAARWQWVDDRVTSQLLSQIREKHPSFWRKMKPPPLPFRSPPRSGMSPAPTRGQYLQPPQIDPRYSDRTPRGARRAWVNGDRWPMARHHGGTNTMDSSYISGASWSSMEASYNEYNK